MSEERLIVLTGGPCCGKTTLIAELARRGLNVIGESAREVLQEGKFVGVGLEFQREIFRRQIEREAGLEAGDHYLDRSAVDVLAYSEYFLNASDEFRNFVLRDKYHRVFVLDRLPFQNDGLRVEADESEANRIHELIVQKYRGLGYNLIRVPVFEGNLTESIRKRADYVLRRAR